MKHKFSFEKLKKLEHNISNIYLWNYSGMYKNSAYYIFQSCEQEMICIYLTSLNSMKKDSNQKRK